ncbi:MAG: hypothetical protein ACK54S_08615 [Alphaproteobacteria bacterium]
MIDQAAGAVPAWAAALLDAGPRPAVWEALGAAPRPFGVAGAAVVAVVAVARVPRPMVSAAPGVLGLVGFVAR